VFHFDWQPARQILLFFFEVMASWMAQSSTADSEMLDGTLSDPVTAPPCQSIQDRWVAHLNVELRDGFHVGLERLSDLPYRLHRKTLK
jgi:hypothetical protein